ncbi:Prolactin-3D4, partial [Cricetulus griseus]
EDLLKAIVNITHSWEEPLKHLLSAVPTLPGASDNMLKSANAVKEKNHILLEGIEAILNKTEDLLKAIVNITHSWEEPLKHLLSAVPTLQGASDNMLKSANAVKERNHILLEGIEAILNRTQVEIEDDAYPDWSGLSDLQSSDEETRLFEFFNLCRCLRRDTHKVDTFLKVLRCRFVYNNECMYYQ